MNLEKYYKPSVYSALSQETEQFDFVEFVQDLVNDFENQTKSKYTIYIPSKGRPDTIRTHKRCEGLKYKIVVEPQDYDSYLNTFGVDQLVKMDKNDQGLPFARNFIKNYSIEQGEKFHWQFDDDIKNFLVRVGNKNVKTNPANCMSIVEQTMDLFSNISISSMTDVSYAFSKKQPVRLNYLTYTCVLVNNSVDVSWRKGTVEDWDYTLLSLEKNYCTMPFCHVLFESHDTGANPGGNQLTEWPTEERRKEYYQNFVNLWPKYFSVGEHRTKTRIWSLRPKRTINVYKQQPILKNEYKG